MNNINWLSPLGHWAALGAVAYIVLIILMVAFLMPAAKKGTLPEKFFELTAAKRKPLLYRIAILSDMTSWIAYGGFLGTGAGLLAVHTPLKSLAIAILTAGLAIGLFGAALRLVRTPALAKQYDEAKGGAAQSAVVHAYGSLLGTINATFSVGGLLAGAAFILFAGSAWGLPMLSHWVLVLLDLSGALLIAKGLLELLTGGDWGPLGLLGGLATIIAYIDLALRFW